MSSFSASGKLMIMGEHAVVYGYPSLVTAVSSRLYVSITPSTNSDVKIHTPQVKDSRFVQAALDVYKDKFKAKLTEMTLSTRSDFYTVNGFGSSAAVTVGTISALADYFKQDISKEDIFRLSYKAIQTVQGVGSGFDVASATYGGTLLFRQGGESIIPLNVPSGNMAFIVAYSGVKANTTEMVQMVKAKRDKESEKVNSLLRSIGELVVQAKEQIEKGEWESVGSLMNKNQEYLCELGVSTPQIDAMIQKALQSGAWGAKLSGAGGGDCIIAIAPVEKKNTVIGGIERAGGQIIDVTINERGVQKEQ